LKTIWLVAAGTGGHIFPALALAEALSDCGVKPIFAGRRGSMEQDLAGKYGFKFHVLPSSGFFGKGPAARAAAAANALIGLYQAMSIVRKQQPAALVAAGGFGSFTPLLAAKASGRPYFLLEQNRIPGRVTRYFARGAAETFLTFPLLRPLAARTMVTGTPLRRTLLATRRRDDGRTVLVLGGSGGARALSLAAVDIARQLPELHFIILTGRRDFPLVSKALTDAGTRRQGDAEISADAGRRTPDAGRRTTNVELIDFTLGMEDLYARASLVVSRAGSMVINEVLSLGLPTILIPFPFATDNHQKANALQVARQGAAICLDQTRLPELSNIIKSLFADASSLAELSVNARRIARRDAAGRIAECIVRRLDLHRSKLPLSIFPRA
jgi:UDP-N-acetylglucosamine--N-acetylmuramyl-(pentapeptide) pyrophosphoryl-undecaprenol N-acetylglucosamine transferase